MECPICEENTLIATELEGSKYLYCINLECDYMEDIKDNESEIKQITDILVFHSENCENQAGVKGNVIWESDFLSIAKEILKL